MDYFELLRHRRSTRRFTAEQISQEDLSKILAAANIAPIGSNRFDDIHLTVVQDRSVLGKLAEASVVRWEDKATMKEIVGDNPKMNASGKPFDPFYEAPVVVFVSHRKQTVQPGIEFSNVAIVAYTMHLAATNLGLGRVLMWFALESMREIPAYDNTAVLKLPDGFEPLIGIAIGRADRALNVRERDANRMTANVI
jgi:nitroreductase